MQLRSFALLALLLVLGSASAETKPKCLGHTPGCKICNADDFHCDVCQDAWFLINGNSCNVCDTEGARCKTCEGTRDKCLTCKDGDYLTSANKCLVCDGNCKTCKTSSKNCLSCPEGKVLLPDNTCGCHAACETCNGKESNNCLTCPFQKFLMRVGEGKTCDSCLQEGYYMDQKNCFPCDSKCKRCGNLSNCYDCKSPYLLRLRSGFSKCYTKEEVEQLENPDPRNNGTNGTNGPNVNNADQKDQNKKSKSSNTLAFFAVFAGFITLLF